MKERLLFRVGDYEKRIKDRLTSWEAEKFNKRLWSKDPSLWSAEPAAEIRDRLGWLELPEMMSEKAEAWIHFSLEVQKENISQVVILGMGGSSLAPEVFQRTLGSEPGYPSLRIQDSTHPQSVSKLERNLDLSHTLFIVSSKSGTTLETLSLFHYFWECMAGVLSQPGRHFAAITDNGTPLMKLALERNFRRIFEAPEDVGGRFSALSDFGLAPAALIGIDVTKLLKKARLMAEACAPSVPSDESQGLILGATLGEISKERNKLTFLTSESLGAFPDWLEQLVAESLGKDGKGIIPVTREPNLNNEAYGNDRIFMGFFLEEDKDEELKEKLAHLEKLGHPTIHVNLQDITDLAQEMFRWEIAVASAGAVWNIHPFNQPDVQLAKDFTKEAMDRGDTSAEEDDSVSVNSPDDLGKAFDAWINQASRGDYVAIQAFLSPSSEIVLLIKKIREYIAENYYLATTYGFGPRFLHSTGQLHKGGPDKGLFLQLVDEPNKGLSIPETDITFDTLIAAQANGDYRAMKKGSRKILRVDLGADVSEGIHVINEMLQKKHEK
jgi:transaldolase/glucose-6-phosphate isomerase